MSSGVRWLAVLLVLSASSSTSSPSVVFDLHQHRPKNDAANVSDSRRLYSWRRLRAHRESHPCELKNFGDVQYHMLVEIGKPCSLLGEKQIFRVVPDTGSSDLWVPAANCTHCSGRRYAAKKSCSAKSLGSRVHFKYGDGTTASGTSVEDTVRIGDLKVADQFFIQVDEMDAVSLDDSDGILGLAHHYRKGPHAKEGMTFMATMFSQHPAMPRQFSLFLTGMDERPSKIVFGDPMVEKHAKEDFSYGKAFYMENTELWLTSVYSIGFSKTGIERVFPTQKILGAPALVDSGSSLIVLKPDIWDDLIAELSHHLRNCRIEDTDGSVAMCNCPEDSHPFEKIPSLVINIIDENDVEKPLCMAAEEYILKSVDPITGNSMCVPAIQRGNSRQPVPLIFGMTFMRAFYTNFDLENNRIGFARSTLSKLPANADCTVHNKKEREFWLATIAFVSIATGFAIYLCCCGDIGACCGWPGCEATKPCYGVDAKDSFEKMPLAGDESYRSSMELEPAKSLECYVSVPPSSPVNTAQSLADDRSQALGAPTSTNKEASLASTNSSMDAMHLKLSTAQNVTDQRPARTLKEPTGSAASNGDTGTEKATGESGTAGSTAEPSATGASLLASTSTRDEASDEQPVVNNASGQR